VQTLHLPSSPSTSESTRAAPCASTVHDYRRLRIAAIIA
jgi:hypothetical protein